MEKWLLKIAKAIKDDRFSFKYGGRVWHGVYIDVEPLFCSYGKIGYTIAINNGGDGTIWYDYELDTLELSDYGGTTVNLWDEDDLEVLKNHFNDSNK